MKPIFSVAILRKGSLLVGLAWLATFYFQKADFDVSTLEPLFTGLAFVAVVAAFVQQRQEAEAGDVEHRDLLAAMARQTKESAKLAEIQGAEMLFQHWAERRRFFIAQFGRARDAQANAAQVEEWMEHYRKLVEERVPKPPTMT